MKKKVLGLIVISLLLMILLTGCNNNGKSQNSNIVVASSGYDPCQLLTADDVQQAFDGVPVEKTKKDPQAENLAAIIGQKSCQYQTVQDSSQLVQLSLHGNTPTVTAQGGLAQYYANFRKIMDGAQDVPGIGDSSFHGTVGILDQLTVLVKSKAVIVQVSVAMGYGHDDPVKSFELEKQLAQKIVSRL